VYFENILLKWIFFKGFSSLRGQSQNLDNLKGYSKND
jgi:hypothetical protein